MSCTRSNNFHRVTLVTVSDTSVVLTVTDSTNIGSLERFNLICRKPVSSLVATSPVPVSIIVNGNTIPVKNAFGLPLMSNLVPFGLTLGRFVIEGTGETATSYVILNTPCYA